MPADPVASVHRRERPGLRLLPRPLRLRREQPPTPGCRWARRGGGQRPGHPAPPLLPVGTGGRGDSAVGARGGRQYQGEGGEGTELDSSVELKLRLFRTYHACIGCGRQDPPAHLHRERARPPDRPPAELLPRSPRPHGQGQGRPLPVRRRHEQQKQQGGAENTGH